MTRHNMQFHKVTSSQVKEIGHDPKTNTLAVRFNNGGEYHYSGVNAVEFAKLRAAKSVGAHLGQHIKGKFDFKKIGHKEDKK